MDDYSRLVTEVNTKKGDVVIFCEAWCATTQATSRLFAALAHVEGAVPCRSIHGALPWRGDHDRRMVLYRFNPGHSAYTPGVAEFNCAPAQPHPLSPR